MPDSLRLAVGTLTALRVPPPRILDRRTAGRAMTWAPLVGLALGLVAAAVLHGLRMITDYRAATVVDLLGSVLAVGVLALATRALHLDGLVDTVDGFGVKGDGEQARERRLAVLREPTAGAFGVAALVLVLLLQVAALTVCTVTGYGTVSLLVAATTSRLAATWCCTPGLPAARPDGLGALVAGSVGRATASVLTVLVLVGAVALGRVDDDHSRAMALTLVTAALVALLVALVVVRHAVDLFGGVTGDVMGAAVEVAFTAALVVVAIGAALATPELAYGPAPPFGR